MITDIIMSNQNTKMGTVSVQNFFTYGHIEFPFNPRTDTVINLEPITLNSGDTTTLSYVSQDDAVKAPNDKVMLSTLTLNTKITGKFKFNIRASNTLDTADGDIIYSRDSEREISTGNTLLLSPLVIDAGKFLTIQLIEGKISIDRRSIVVTNDI